jgi:hypothetical protein
VVPLEQLDDGAPVARGGARDKVRDLPGGGDMSSLYREEDCDFQGMWTNFLLFLLICPHSSGIAGQESSRPAMIVIFRSF